MMLLNRIVDWQERVRRLKKCDVAIKVQVVGKKPLKVRDFFKKNNELDASGLVKKSDYNKKVSWEKYTKDLWSNQEHNMQRRHFLHFLQLSFYIILLYKNVNRILSNKTK